MKRRVFLALVFCGILLMAKSGRAQASGGYYHFDEGAGATAHDASGSGNDGQIQGATFVAGRTTAPADHSLHFQNTNDSVQLPFSVISNFSNKAYVEAWIRPVSYPAGAGCSAVIFQKRSPFNDWTFGVMAGGVLTTAIFDQSHTDAVGVAGGIAPLNVWSKVASWYDGTTLRILVNGVEAASASHVVVPDWSAIRVEIGNDTVDSGINCGDYGFKGDIDEVLISESGPGGAVYHLDEGSGSIALDSSGAGNNAAISGATYIPGGYSGSALHFGSQNDTVLVPQSIFNGFGNTAYFEARIRPTDRSTCGGDRTIFRKRSQSGWEWILYMGAAGEGATCVLYVPNTMGIGVTAGTVPLNQWSKVACGYDGSRLRLLVNDVEVGHQDANFSIDWNANYIKTEIGNDTFDTGVNCGDYSFHGDIDEVTISSVVPPVGPPPCPNLDSVSPAKTWIGLKNSDDVGTKFDLLAEVFRNGVLAGSGELDGVAGGSSGFNNASLRTINLSLSGSTSICPGDTVSVRLSVRVAASSGHRSGTARLWFNDSAANSHVEVTVGGVQTNLYLRTGFILSTTPGAGPKQTVDVLVDRAVGGNPFKPFGTWTGSM